MRFYSIHIRRQGLDLDNDFAVIKEGFSWPAFFLNGLWALWHCNWLAAAGIFIILFIIAVITSFAGGSTIFQFVLCLGWFFIIGVLANDLRRHQLYRAGYSEVGLAFGQTPDAALYLYLKEASR